MKKKKEKEVKEEVAAFSQTSSRKESSSRGGRFQCSSNSYPLTYGTCHPDVGVLQRYLKSFNMDLGKSGRNQDGIDMQFGTLTKTAALKKLGKDTFTEADIKGIKSGLKFVGR